jgi:hypothetical protein
MTDALSKIYDLSIILKFFHLKNFLLYRKRNALLTMNVKSLISIKSVFSFPKRIRSNRDVYSYGEGSMSLWVYWHTMSA